MTHAMVTAPSGIGYPVWRSGAGFPLVLLHGFTGSHRTWEHLVDHLSTDRLVVTIDLPGHGKSELPSAQSWTFGSVIDDLAWIIESLLGGNADVLGYSMGGRIALALAVTHPGHVRSLILESASPGIADQQVRRARQIADERLAERILHDGLPAFVAHWERLPMWHSQAALSEGARERQRQIRLGHTSTGLAANLRVAGTGVQPSYWEHLADMRVPALLIAGDLDHKFAQTARGMHEALPNSHLEIVASAGHAVHLEQPAWYVARISQFLEQPVLSTTQARRSDRD